MLSSRGSWCENEGIRVAKFLSDLLIIAFSTDPHGWSAALAKIWSFLSLVRSEKLKLGVHCSDFS